MATNEGNVEDLTDWDKTELDPSFIELRLDNSRESSMAEPENLRREGEVLLSYWSKLGQRFTSVPMDMQLEDVAIWLNKGTEYSLPISYSKSLESHRKLEDHTLSDIVG